MSKDKPCPNCGHCPMCGHSPKPAPVVVYPVYPWGVQPPTVYPGTPYWLRSPNVCTSGAVSTGTTFTINAG